MQKQKISTRCLALLLSLLLLAGCFSGCGSGETTAGSASKTITFTAVHQDGSEKEFTIETEEEFLRGALEQEKLIEGEESDYGLFVKTVDGETVDDANQEWWCLTIDGEMATTGVDDTEVTDGGKYTFTFTVGY